jgi:hypothetical protein
MISPLLIGERQTLGSEGVAELGERIWSNTVQLLDFRLA